MSRPILTVDGTHLYGKYKHHLLIAYRANGDNKILPVGSVIVPGKTGEAWAWFLRKIKKEVVRERSGETIFLISDRGSESYLLSLILAMVGSPPSRCIDFVQGM